MSTTTISFLYCDGGYLCPQNGAPFTTDGALKKLTVATQREHARALGWRYAAGKDLCPDCSKRLWNDLTATDAGLRLTLTLLRSLDVFEAYLGGDNLSTIARARKKNPAYIRRLMWRAYWVIVRAYPNFFNTESKLRAEPLNKIILRKQEYLTCIHTMRGQTLAHLPSGNINFDALWIVLADTETSDELPPSTGL